MKAKDISQYLISPESSLKYAMETINNGRCGAVIIVDKDGVMQGIITDGDVRRTLMSGGSLDDIVVTHMSTEFVYGKTRDSHEDNVSLMTDKIRHIPILDSKGCPVEFISWAGMWRLPVTEPYLAGNELKYVSDCITSNWISSQGHYLGKFEKIFADYLSIDHAIAVSSGTAALHLALKAIGVGYADEVILPSLTFGACANVVKLCGATPVFVDVSDNSWTMNPLLIEGLITEKTKAIMPVHLYGHPCDMDPIIALAKKYNLFVIEDCAQALGSRYKSHLAGTFGDISCFSFFANKVITTGEGGMCVTRNVEIKEKINMLRDHGMSRDRRYWHDLVGFNYRLTNIQAAIGLAQMEKIDDFLDKRRILTNAYTENLKGVNGITLPPAQSWAENIFWLYSILIDEQILGISAAKMIKRLATEGIDTRPFFQPLHKQPPFFDSSINLSVTDRLADQGISLPTGNDVGINDVEMVCHAIRRIINNANIL